jgi:serine/threonine protein kinase
LASNDALVAFERSVVRGDVIAERYEVADLIGRGGIGFVVSARDRSSDEWVAIKLLRPECAFSDEAVRRFRLEAAALAKIDSDRIVSVLALSELADGTPFMVMELLRGFDLGRVLATHGPLAIERAVGYVLQACEGLAAAHAAGVRHFDLKPANLFLVDAGQLGEYIKLIDFGVIEGPAHALENYCSGDTLIGLGSPPYMSPEQRRGEPRDDRSDIWSLGCVLYELLAGEPLSRRRGALGMGAPSIIVDEAELGPCLACPHIPPGLEAVIRRCVEPQPSSRFGDAAELAAALIPFASEDDWAVSEHCWQLLHAGEQAALADTERTERGREYPPPTKLARVAQHAMRSDVLRATPWPYESNSLFAYPGTKSRHTKLVLGLLIAAALLVYSAYASVSDGKQVVGVSPGETHESASRSALPSAFQRGPLDGASIDRSP